MDIDRMRRRDRRRHLRYQNGSIGKPRQIDHLQRGRLAADIGVVPVGLRLPPDVGKPGSIGDLADRQLGDVVDIETDAPAEQSILPAVRSGISPDRGVGPALGGGIDMSEHPHVQRIGCLCMQRGCNCEQEQEGEKGSHTGDAVAAMEGEYRSRRSVTTAAIYSDSDVNAQ